MSGAWEEAMTDELNMAQIQVDHARDLTAIQDRLWKKYGIHRFGESFKQGVRRDQPATIGWLLHKQMRVNELTAEEVVAELRKGPASIYYPIWCEDMRIWVECPSGVAHYAGARVLVDAEGYCDTCGYDFTTGARVAPPKDHKETT